MTVETHEALDDIGNFRECLNDPHDFDQAMARLRAAVAEQAADVELLTEQRDMFREKAHRFIAGFNSVNDRLGAVAALLDRWDEMAANHASQSFGVAYDPGGVYVKEVGIRAIAEQEVDYLSTETKQHAHLVSRRVTEWQAVTP